MSKVTARSKAIVTGVILLFVCPAAFVGAMLFLDAVGLPGHDYNANLPAGVTKAGIKAVRLGMSSTEVSSVLGPPVSAAPESDGSGTVMQYHSEVSGWYYWYPALWIHLDESGKVRSIYTKRKGPAAWGDESPYGLSSEMNYEKSELFEKTFLR